MKYHLPKNAVIEFMSGGGVNRSVRVIYAEVKDSMIAVFDLEDKNALPEWIDVAELEGDFDAGNARFAVEDRYVPPPLNEEEITPSSYLTLKERMEHAKSIIAPIVSGRNEFEILFPKSRGRLIKNRLAACEKERANAKQVAESSTLKSSRILQKLEEELNIPTRQTVMSWLRKFWSGGMIYATLVPDYDKCGAPGEPRTFTDKKPGPKSNEELATGIRSGVVMNDEWRKKIITGGKMFYENRKKLSLKLAYDLTLDKICGTTDPNTKERILPDPEKGEVFTFHQFRYHYEKERRSNLRRVLIARHGKHEFSVNLAPRTGTVRNSIFGPGSQYQIDATVADTSLSSSINRLGLVGRPTFYIVIDAFSKMIVGFSVGLENEGWLGYRTSLINVVEDKVEFCRKWGIEITADDWPNMPLPDQILGDRGAMVSNISDSLIDGLGIQLSNAATNRPDWKTYVENSFSVFNMKIFDYIPGAVNKKPRHGDPDYRHGGHLTLDQLTEMLIHTIIDYNKNHRMDNFKMDADMLADNVNPYPIAINEWGTHNRSIPTRRHSVDEVSRILLPTDEGSVTTDGIKFKNLFYTCERMVSEDWQLQARNLKNWKLQIAHDPRKIEPIYIRTGRGTEMIECILKDRNSPFIGLSRMDVNSYFTLKNREDKHAESATRQTDSNLRQKYDVIIKKSKKEHNLAKKNSSEQVSNKGRINAIDGNRREEIDNRNMTEQNAFMPEHCPQGESFDSTELDNRPIKPKKSVSLQDLQRGIDSNAKK